MADFEIETDAGNDLTVCTFHGTLKRGEMALAVGGKEMQRPTRLLLFDLRDASYADQSQQAMVERTLTYGPLFAAPGSRTAMVYGNAADFGVGRMLESYFDSFGIGTELRSFRDIEDARDWLLSPAM